MRRISTDEFPHDGFSVEHERGLSLIPTFEWESALLTAHIERESGPDLRILRAQIGDGSAHQVTVSPDDEEEGPQSVVLIDENELIIALSTGETDEGDASVLVGFEVDAPVKLTAYAIDEMPLPPIVLRNYGEKAIYVLSDDGESTDLTSGKWTLQAAAVPGGIDRMSLLEFTSPESSTHNRRKSA